MSIKITCQLVTRMLSWPFVSPKVVVVVSRLDLSQLKDWLGCLSSPVHTFMEPFASQLIQNLLFHWAPLMSQQLILCWGCKGSMC